MIRGIRNWLSGVLGNTPGDPYALDQNRRRQMLIMLSILGIIAVTALAALAMVQHDMILAGIDLALLVSLAVILIWSRHTKQVSALALAGLIVMGFLFLALLGYGGVGRAAHLWSFTFPMMSLFLLGARRGSILSLAYLGLAALLLFPGRSFELVADYPVSFSLRYISAYFTVFVMSLVLESLREVAFRRMQEYRREQERLVKELREKVAEVRTLRGILPICSNCRKVRNDQGYWQRVELYVQTHSEARFSHGICPDCMRELYPELQDESE